MPGRVRRFTRARRVAVVLALVVVAGGLVVGWCGSGSQLGRFDSPAGEQAYRDAYAAAMGRLPAPTRTDDVATDYGTVRVYAFGEPRQADGVPILLMPGRSSGVPMWLANLPALAAARPVLAVDTLGDAGLSVQTRPLLDSADQAAWIEQALARLGVERVHVVGHSFGGWLAANYAVRYPARVATLSLLEPVLVFEGLRWQFIAATIPASLKFLPQSWRDAGLSYIGGDEAPPDPDDPVARMIAAAAEHYAAQLPMPGRPSDDELRRLRMPVYVAFASRSVVHDASAALAQAKALVPGVEGRVWDGATHSLPLEDPEAVNRELLGFLAKQDRQPPPSGAR